MTNLAEALPIEMARVRAMKEQYLGLPGGVGRPAAHLMELSLRSAESAAASGDVVAMIRAHEDLKGYTG